MGFDLSAMLSKFSRIIGLIHIAPNVLFFKIVSRIKFTKTCEFQREMPKVVIDPNQILVSGNETYTITT